MKIDRRFLLRGMFQGGMAAVAITFARYFVELTRAPVSEGALAALVLVLARGRWRRLVVVLAVLVVLLVAAARLYRGAHYPTDLLGSLLFAVPWLLVTLRVLHVPDRAAADP